MEKNYYDNAGGFKKAHIDDQNITEVKSRAGKTNHMGAFLLWIKNLARNLWRKFKSFQYI